MLDKTVDDVRAAARGLVEALDHELAAEAASREAALALAATAEQWCAPRLMHAVWREAYGLQEDVKEHEQTREYTRQEAADFLELIELAATDRKEAASVC